MPVFYASFGTNTATIGTLVSFVAMLTFVCGALQGLASDYFGRSVMLRICAVAQLCGHFTILYSLYINSFALFVVARCMPALFKCCMVVSQAFLFDIESRQEDLKSSELGTLYAYSNLAFIIGPLLGGISVSRSIYYPSVLGCVLSVIELLTLTAMTDLPARKRKSSMSSTDNPDSADYNTGSLNNQISSAHSSIPSKLTHLLHVKFACQLSTSLFEALFPQHGRSQFGLTGYTTGLLFSVSGALSGFTNMYLLRPVLASTLRVEDQLLLCMATTATGLFVWALCSNLTG